MNATRDRALSFGFAGMLAMVLRDPAHAEWLPQHPVGRKLMGEVFKTLAPAR